MSSWAEGYVADLGYTHGFYRELTPAMLSFAGLAKSKLMPDAMAPMAYCELGCGQGFTTNLLAAANPHIAFYANDFNPAHIVGARMLAAEAKTTNVQFYDSSFAQFLNEPSLPDLDVITLHGIYSWVSADNRNVIIEFIRRKLKPGGIVYLSYNAMPGWSAAAPMRKLIQLHGKSQGGATVGRVDPALDFVSSLIDAQARYFMAIPALKDRFTKVRAQDKNYLAHEYMNDAWNLPYFCDVAGELDQAKLTFVASASLLDHLDNINLTAGQQKILAAISDTTFRETVRDFMINQQFRKDIFIKGAVPLSVQESYEKIANTRFALSTAPHNVKYTVTGALGDAALEADVYGPLIELLTKGPCTGRQMNALPAIAARGYSSLLQALLVLIGAGHLQPCLDQSGDTKRVKSTTAFNNAVLRQAALSDDLHFLASPVTGGGVIVHRFARLFLLGRLRKEADVANFAWRALKAQGQKMSKEGATIESEDDSITEMRGVYQRFLDGHLPTLQTLGVA